jgi:ABC-type transport system involved in cytochrome c biogenesis permease subunit
MSKLAQVAAARLNRLQLCLLLPVRWQTCVRQYVARWTPRLYCCTAIALLWLLLRLLCAIPEQVAELRTKRVVMLHVQLGIYVR